MEEVVVNNLQSELKQTYRNRRVLVTGHTGFKGSWLTFWLHQLGARVAGYSLAPDSDPALFHAIGIQELCEHHTGDVRDYYHLQRVIREFQPEVIFHLAAQAQVQRSYSDPLDTIETNITGTANLLEAVRTEGLSCAIVCVTSDKCYENFEDDRAYNEEDRLGGGDIYSMSKGAVELLVSSFRRSFFPPAQRAQHGVTLATARGGNVIGGGDWSSFRVVPNTVVALSQRQTVELRNPTSTRPWQHVFDALSGYLLLGSRLCSVGTTTPERFCEAWNFGPPDNQSYPVRQVVEAIIATWRTGGWRCEQAGRLGNEAKMLRLSIEKAITQLGWRPRWSFQEMVFATAEWYLAFYLGGSITGMRAICDEQIRSYLSPRSQHAPVSKSPAISDLPRYSETTSRANAAAGYFR